MSERKHVEVCECPSMWYGRKEMEMKISKSFCLYVNVEGMGMAGDAGCSRAFIRFFRLVPFDRLLCLLDAPSSLSLPFVPPSQIFLRSLLHNCIDLLSSPLTLLDVVMGHVAWLRVSVCLRTDARDERNRKETLTRVWERREFGDVEMGQLL